MASGDPMRLRTTAPAAPALLLAALLSGCLGPAWEMEPLDIDLDIEIDLSGAATLESFQADASYDLSAARATVRVEGVARVGENVSAPRVHAYLVDRPCPKGPSGAPQDPVDHETVHLGEGPAGARPFEAQVEGRILPGTPYSVRLLAEPGGLGPNFARCHDLTALPTAPAASAR